MRPPLKIQQPRGRAVPLRLANGTLHVWMNIEDARDTVSRGWVVFDGIRYDRVTYEDAQPEIVRCESHAFDVGHVEAAHRI